MEEKYFLNRNKMIVQSSYNLVITFKNNINSIGVFISFFFTLMIGICAGLILRSDSVGFSNLIYRPQIIILLLLSLSFAVLTFSEITLRFRIHILNSKLILVSTRFGKSFIKHQIATRDIVSIQKVMTRSSIGDTGSTKVYWPQIGICDNRKNHIIVPVTLDERDVDDLVNILQDFLNSLK